MLTLEQLEEIFPYHFISKNELYNSVLELSELFTKRRDRIGEYQENKRFVSAYLYFYYKTNIPKFVSILKMLPQEFQEDMGKLNWVDIGCGPGTLFSSLLKLLPDYNGSLVGVETSLQMRAIAKKIMELQKTQAQWKYCESPPSGLEDNNILVFTHSLNEMGVESAKKYIDKVNHKWLLFIEPGTKEVFSTIKHLRTELVSEGYHVHYPCFGNSICPMSENDWCHQILKVTQESEVESLCQKLKKDRRTMPAIFHLYSKSSRKNKGHRVIRTYPPTKFGFELDVCSCEKEELEIEKLETYKKYYSKSDYKKLKEVNSGQEVNYKTEKELSDKKRVKFFN